MKRILLLYFLIHFTSIVFAQIDLDVYLPEGDSTDSTFVGKSVSIYSSPGEYLREINDLQRMKNELFYLVTIKEKKNNFFRVEPQFQEDAERGFSGWIHTGDVYAIIQNLSDIKINLYTNPWDKIPTGYICDRSRYAAVYDIVGNYVLVKLLSDEDSTSDNIWGWIHKCHLEGQPYTTNPSINHIEY